MWANGPAVVRQDDFSRDIVKSALSRQKQTTFLMPPRAFPCGITVGATIATWLPLMAELPGCISQVLNARFEPSQVLVLRGNRLKHNTRTISIEWTPVRSLSFYLSYLFHFLHQLFLPQLIKLFLHYLQIVTWECNTSSCFVWAFVCRAESGPLAHWLVK